MRIWFDLTNSPHVQFFRQMMAELSDEGHDIVVTSRDAANTVDLLNLYGIPYHSVGGFYGKSLLHKVAGNSVRVRELVKFVKSEQVDAGISQSSFTSAIAGRLAGVPTIYTNDNEHALGNKVSFACAHHVFVPQFIDVDSVAGAFVARDKVTQYPGVKEGIYLWQRYLSPTVSGDGARDKVYYRPEPYYAQYYKGDAHGVDDVLVALKDEVPIVILPRDKTQAARYREARFAGITVCDTPLTFDRIVKDCRLFIGAGGTMTREMAVVGVPTVSVYQDQLLEVDKFLISTGHMSHSPTPTAAELRTLLERSVRQTPDKELLEMGREAYRMIKRRLLSMA